MDKNKLLTYKEWNKLFKHNLRSWLFFTLFIIGLPVGMAVHWLLFGY